MNQSRLLHSRQRVATLPRQRADTPTPIWCEHSHFQYEGRETRDPSVAGRRKCSQARDILLGDVRLLQETMDFSLVHQGVPLLSRHPATLAANMGTLSFTPEGLVRPDALAENAESSHHEPLAQKSPTVSFNH
jgi:hypothetical protein